MKTTITYCLFLLSISLCAQDIMGKWHGTLDIQGMELRLTFHIEKTPEGYTSTLDSPDQGALGIPVSSTLFTHPDLHIVAKDLGITYDGVLHENDSIIGIFQQGGQSFPLNLSKTKIKKKPQHRPQEPSEPYSYYTEDVIFANKMDSLTLAGTLSLPKKQGKFPAVILISGSGPQDRNEEILGHKPFLVLADYLTRNGIAVLRYDDRGTAQSTGDFANATTKDFITDVESAMAYLKTRKEIDLEQIGLIGHSEGGIIAPMVASTTDNVSFIVLLAGTGIPGDELLLLQQQAIAEANGATDDVIQESLRMNAHFFDIIKNSTDVQALRKTLTRELNEYLNQQTEMPFTDAMTQDEFIAQQVASITTPWMIYFLKLDPAVALLQVKCPVLVLNGAKDLQVPSKVNLNAIENALIKAGNSNYKIKELPHLNHLFQEAKTGSPNEYAQIEQTISPVVLEEVTHWIKQQVE